MSFFLDAKNACSLIAMGEWREFIFRIRVHIQKIDLKNCSLDELQLPEERCHDYANSGGLSLETVLRALKITSRDAIVDFGSGKGGALITMARYPFARIMGVEISPELVAIARRNLHKLGIGNVAMVTGDQSVLPGLRRRSGGWNSVLYGRARGKSAAFLLCEEAGAACGSLPAATVSKLDR